MLIYESLVASYLRYGIPAWGNTTHSLLNRLQAAQNKVIRYLTYSPPMTNVDDKYVSLKVMDVKTLFFL